jgi:translation elongation factor EF-G
MVEYREGYGVDFATEELQFKVEGVALLQASFSVRSRFASDTGSSSEEGGRGTLSTEGSEMTVSISPECEARIKTLLDPTKTSAQQKAELDAVRDFGNVLKANLKHTVKCGPLAGLPQVGASIFLETFKMLTTSVTPAQMEAAARQLLRDTLLSCRVSKLVLLEPMMTVHVVLTEAAYMGDVITCLSAKSAVSVDTTEDCKEITAVVPMRNLVRFGTELRQVAKGNGYFWMNVDHYRVVADEKIRSVILRNRGITD